MEEKIYLALLHSLGITQKKFHIIFWENLLWEKMSYQVFYETMNREMLQSFWIKSKEMEKILERKKKIKREFIEKRLEERDVEIITIEDGNYPEELKNISNIPYLLYIRGEISNQPKIAVVGARKISSYGKKVIESIVPEVSNYFPIVSGGAFGCDTFAHLAALEAWNITISVIGTSICEDYPTGNKKMYDNIVRSGGAVISLFPIWVPWSAYNFPIRNEIVAGLSVGTLVIEAQHKSGSLITAWLALDIWKDLFAIPWEIFKSNSAWCNDLIRRGEAKPVSDATHILEEYNVGNWWGDKKQKELELDDQQEKQIYNALLVEWYSSDELAKKLEIDISTLNFKLSMLEIKWVIKKTLWWKFEVK